MREHYDGDQTAALVALVGLINAANRPAVIVHRRGRSYQPGMFEVAMSHQPRRGSRDVTVVT